MSKIFVDLTGNWQFKEYPLSARNMRDLETSEWLQTAVPSSIFNSLITADKIDKKQLYSNPENFEWVSEKPWIYKKQFDASAKLLNCQRIDLVFQGLDTIANIWLNEKLVAKTDNMFIPFRFNVKEILKAKNNSLMVKFEPPVKHAKELMNKYTKFSGSDFLNPHRVYIRKAQFQFGWDFCPALPGCGIWKPVQLEGIDNARIEDIHIKTIDCNDNQADLRIDIKLDTATKQKYECELMLSCKDQKIKHQITFESGEDLNSTIIHIKKPHLWWPAGYGQQNLYQLDAKLTSNNYTLHHMQKKIGIRTVKLHTSTENQKPDFNLQINDQHIFAKGANWIPPSIFAGSVNHADYESLLTAAVKANMNMLRIWGGGYYETEQFYGLCDELGIMVWQDFMFACAYYPENQWFTKQIKKEATAVIKQIRNHSSIVLWCGNNEIDWLHSLNAMGKNKKFLGKNIYHKILPKILAELSPTTPYLPTTPMSQNGKFKNNKLITKHNWDIWAFHKPARDYITSSEEIPTFVTEFGLQSIPTIKTICPNEKLRLGCQPLEKHNYQLDGNSRLYRYTADMFASPKDLEQFIYLSQVTQARAVKLYAEYLRANRKQNKGLLFWQLNDCFPAITWSAIDHLKNLKAIYYYAKRFFANQLITIVPELEKQKANSLPQLKSISVVAVNDSNEPLTGTINCNLINMLGEKTDQVQLPIALKPFACSTPIKLPKTMTLPPDPKNSVLHLMIKNKQKTIAQNIFLYYPDKYIDWPKSNIKIHTTTTDNKLWTIKLQSNVLEKDVQINSSIPAQLNDNFLDLLPDKTTEITAQYKKPQPNIKQHLTTRSINSAF